jgi:hypothetical protein
MMTSSVDGKDRTTLTWSILHDLIVDDLLNLEPGERLWKLYSFRSAVGRATNLEHRIYTKVKTNGRLALVTFVVHTPAEGRSSRSGTARVPDLTADALEQIIGAIQREADVVADGNAEIDLSDIGMLDEQLSRLQVAGQ